MPRITRKAGLMALAFFVLTIGGALSARADTITVVGNTTPALATATVNCTFNAQTNTFTFTITNTSPFDARITGIGFDLPPDGNASPSGLNGFSGADVGAFTFSDADLGSVPQFNSAVLDFGFTTGNTFSGGSPNDGIAPGDSLTFVVSGPGFTGFTEEQICEAIFVRFQRVGANGQGSDVGRPGENPIPEPTTMILLGTGLAGIAAKARRRRKVTQVD